MAYNFKSIADVEVVAEPTESANVLIEENGVIKKAPKTAVGGAGGAGDALDMVISVNDEPSAWISEGSYSIVEGSVQAVCDAIRSGRVPVVKIRFCCNMDHLGDATVVTASEADVSVAAYGEELYFMYHTESPYGGFITVGRIAMDLNGNYIEFSQGGVNMSWYD
jgi:hypothetical protein